VVGEKGGENLFLVKKGLGGGEKKQPEIHDPVRWKQDSEKKDGGKGKERKKVRGNRGWGKGLLRGS